MIIFSSYRWNEKVFSANTSPSYFFFFKSDKSMNFKYTNLDLVQPLLSFFFYPYFTIFPVRLYFLLHRFHILVSQLLDY